MNMWEWDIGDPEPDESVNGVETVDITDEDDEPIRFGRTYTPGEWKSYYFGCKHYLDWADVVRRFGPVREAS